MSTDGSTRSKNAAGVASAVAAIRSFSKRPADREGEHLTLGDICMWLYDSHAL